jgi:hypothetical protein
MGFPSLTRKTRDNFVVLWMGKLRLVKERQVVRDRELRSELAPPHPPTREWDQLLYSGGLEVPSARSGLEPSPFNSR